MINGKELRITPSKTSKKVIQRVENDPPVQNRETLKIDSDNNSNNSAWSLNLPKSFSDIT